NGAALLDLCCKKWGKHSSKDSDPEQKRGLRTNQLLLNHWGLSALPGSNPAADGRGRVSIGSVVQIRSRRIGLRNISLAGPPRVGFAGTAAALDSRRPAVRTGNRRVANGHRA